VTRRPRFQAMPALTNEAQAALRDDIAVHGVQVPILCTTKGDIVDGHCRAAIAEELGVDCPRLTVDLDDTAAIETALRLNLLRRHLGPIAWAQAFRRLAEVRGVADRIGAPGRPTANADTLSALSKELGVDPRTARRRLRLADTLADHPDLAARVDRGEVDSHRAEELARMVTFERRRAEAAPPPVTRLGDGIEVRHGDFREVLANVADQSVDAIVTDPPYDKAGVPLFADFARLAARVLKPGRLAAIYAGKLALDEEMRHLADGGLSYVWHGAVFLRGRHTNVRSRMVRGLHRSVLLYSAGHYLPRHWIVDAVLLEEGHGGPESRPLHQWQQAIDPVRHWVRAISEPGEVVLDPFCGSGTTAVACVAERRRFLGCDIDAGSVATTIERLHSGEAAGPAEEQSRRA
jgi:ParB-like chromosome segregation protein Spo0J